MTVHPGDTSGIDNPGTRVDFYTDGVLQTAVEIGVTLPGVRFRRWEVQVPAGLMGSHTLEARFYGEGVLMGVHTATMIFS